MKYIVFTVDGEGLPIAKKLQDEGNDVLVGIVEEKKMILTSAEKRADGYEGALEKKRRLSLYKNLVDRVSADYLLKKLKKVRRPQDYFIFFDFNTLFRYSEELQNLGFNGNFPTEKDRLFEVDRDEAKNFVKKYYPQIKIADKEEFRSIRRGKKFLKETNGGRVWVLKGKGTWAPTFIPTTNDPELAKWQVIETLEAFQSYYEEVGFVLEQKISDAIEITPEKMYYDGVPLAMCLNFENKPIGSGNLSLQSGCAADLVFPLSMDNPIHDIAFPPIVDKLAQRHKGLFFWDASLLISKKTGEIYFGEFCPNRPWYNSFFTYLSQMHSVTHFFESVTQKKNPFTSGTVGVSTSLFNLLRDPAERHLLSGASINYTDDSSYNIWPWDVQKKTKNDKMRIVGYDWQLASITGSGSTLKEAVNNLYRHVDEFSLAGVYYRPKSDFLSLDYPTSILNRLEYALKRKLFMLPFTHTI